MPKLSRNLPLTFRGRKPLPPERVLEDGLPKETREWLAATAQRLQVSQQHIIRIALQRLRRALDDKEAHIDIAIEQDRS